MPKNIFLITAGCLWLLYSAYWFGHNAALRSPRCGNPFAELEEIFAEFE
jgi:hypothetical protein